jgi:hypothetical protein
VSQRSPAGAARAQILAESFRAGISARRVAVDSKGDLRVHHGDHGIVVIYGVAARVKTPLIGQVQSH